MVADFFYADYGWHRSPDGKEKAWAPFRVGKRHDGYFDNENIHTQAACASSHEPIANPKQSFIQGLQNCVQSSKI